MTDVAEVIEAMREQWSEPREAVHRGQPCPFRLVCRFLPESSEIAVTLGVDTPPDLAAFWGLSEGATLFKDELYGQWGLELLPPRQTRIETARNAAARPQEFWPSDLVIGKFVGDLDLVVVRCDRQSGDFGHVLISQQVYSRADWPIVASSLGEFLARLLEGQGDKYWESR